MRSRGERVEISFPHNADFKRKGRLVRVSDTIPPRFGRKRSTPVWEVELEATPTQARTTRTYSEIWLKNIEQEPTPAVEELCLVNKGDSIVGDHPHTIERVDENTITIETATGYIKLQSNMAIVAVVVKSFGE